MSVKVDEVGHK
jgi:hypothetical protein